MKILIIFLISFLFNNSQASQVSIKNDEGEDEQFQQTSQIEHDPNFIKAMDNFAVNEILIQNYLSVLKEAELHFFWTTGYTIADNPDYQPDKKFNVGGLKYGLKFFPYVGKLLEFSPSHLKVKFICDTPTLEFNRDQINKLNKTRFEIVPIEIVEENLLRIFSSENQQQKIKALFKNATQGNPAIVSDIYRIIGMVYGHNPIPTDITQSQYTYCDIDTFCYGMEDKNEFNDESLIKSLFKKKTKPSFYFGRAKFNNDLIKLHINNLENYKNFCDRIFNKLDISCVAINYYTKIHDTIKSYETSLDSELDIKSLLPDVVEDMIKKVVDATGPNMLDEDMSYDLNFYPITYGGEWYPKENLLDFQEHLHRFPTYCLEWDFNSAGLWIRNQRIAIEPGILFSQQCKDYKRYVSAAVYAKRFGDQHPFNISVKKYLIENFPYHSISFKNLLLQNFELHHQEIIRSYHLIPYKNSGVIVPSEQRISITRNNDKIVYTLMLPDQTFIEDELNIDFKGPINDLFIATHKNEILKQLSEQGHKIDPLKGLTKQEWMNETYERLNRYSHLAPENPKSIIEIRNKAHHYSCLVYLLKTLNIDISITKDTLDI